MFLMTATSTIHMRHNKPFHLPPPSLPAVAPAAAGEQQRR